MAVGEGYRVDTKCPHACLYVYTRGYATSSVDESDSHGGRGGIEGKCRICYQIADLRDFCLYIDTCVLGEIGTSIEMHISAN